MSKEWDEPRPPAPRDHELTLGEWLEEIDLEYGWDSDELVLYANDLGSSWENDFPQRHLAVELGWKGEFYETTITSAHHFDEKESHG
jgi:hypothetical protein